MGGRGTYSKGLTPIQQYEQYDGKSIAGIKVLKPIAKRSWRLPEENHTSPAYILSSRKDGVFHQYREYNEDHTAKLDIDYHAEASLGTGNRLVLHIHTYYDDHGVWTRGPARFLTKKEYRKYERFFVGVPKGAWKKR